MKSYKDLSVHAKMPLMMGVASVLILVFACLLLMLPLRSKSFKESSKIAQLTAVEAGNHLAVRINGVAKIVRTYSGIIELLAESAIIPREKKREWLLAEMEMTYKREPALHNLWCTLEPDALDGMDAYFSGREDMMGSDANGVFATRFADGKMTVSDSQEDYERDYYLIPKETGREIITEPYLDVFIEKNMFSFCVPVMLNGKFIGVVGTDFDIDYLSNMITSLNRNSFGKLVTTRGAIAVHHDQSQIGKPTEDGNEEILQKLSEGKLFEGIYQFEGVDVYMVYVPVFLGEGSNPWNYAVHFPLDEIYSLSRQTFRYLIFFCLFGAVMIALAGWMLIRPMLKDVSALTGFIRKLSLGHINLHIDAQENQDEIGVMKSELIRLTEGLKHTAGFAQNIGKGNFNAEYRTLSKDDALGNSLLEMRQSLLNIAKEQSLRAKEDEQRNWGAAGLAKFSEILRSDNDNLETLSYNIINNMVKYLNVNQGGIFLLKETENERDRVLEMKACYAFDRRKMAEGEILPGEGLVGACFLEGETIYMTEVPERYINITSGLGGANPNAILISPLKLNDEIFGVVELASFNEIEPYQIEFVKKLCESIAATLSTVRVNLRTNRLLEQTKMQTEEMHNQGEELRQNMEEMRATQEDMRRREAELKIVLSNSQKSETRFKKLIYWYEASLNALETPVMLTDKSGKISFINKALLEIIGKTKDEALGKKCAEVCKFENCSTENCSLKLLKQGINRTEVKIGDRTFSLFANYLTDNEGKNIGHIETLHVSAENTTP